jgi:hypothetical protein
MLDDVVGVAGVVHRQAGTPLGVSHHSCPELGIVRHGGFIGCTGQQGDKAQALFAGDVQPTMLGQHVLVAAQPFGVAGRTAHHFTPPGHDVAAMLITHLATPQGRQQLIVFDEVVEPTQPTLKGRPAPAQSEIVGIWLVIHPPADRSL